MEWNRIAEEMEKKEWNDLIFLWCRLSRCTSFARRTCRPLEAPTQRSTRSVFPSSSPTTVPYRFLSFALSLFLFRSFPNRRGIHALP
jgi:hypothetical protein